MRAAIVCLALALIVPTLAAEVPAVCNLAPSLPPSKNTPDFVARLNIGATEIHEWKLLVSGTTRSITD